MNEPVRQSGSSAASPARPGEAAVVRAHKGQQTVINPERRAVPVPIADAPALTGSSAKSSIVRVLFPTDDEQAVQTFDAQSGVQLGHFTVIERIRTGGMGAVFRALDTRLSRVVALKVLPPALSRDPLIVQRFKNEAQAAAQLDHENVARVYFIGEDQGLHYIAFEFINGTNVRDLIAQQGRLPVGEAVNYILQIASALVHTSAQGVVHRDIKPSNIIITPAGRAKLVDLGLARKENREDQAVELTVAGTTLGTFDYISPEQARDPRAADVRSDIYSLGCTLYHMLTGEPPYPEGTVLQKLLQHQGDEAPDPSLKNRLVPENLSVVVRKMMAKDPRRRYQSSEQLVRDLMLVAGALGLRSVSPEGLVWLASQPEQASFWERHLAWMVTAALLFLIVGYMEFGERLFPPAPTTASQTGASQIDSEGKGLSRVNSRSGGDAVGRGTDADRPQPEKGANGSHRARREETSPGGEADEDAKFPHEDDPSTLVRGRGPGGSRESTGDEGNARPDDPGAEITPVPLTGTGRNDGGIAIGPRFEAQEYGSGIAAPKTVAELLLVPARGGLSPGQPVAATARNADPEGATVEDLPRTAQAEHGPDADAAPAVSVEEEVFVVLGRDNSPARSFKTLEAACSSVRENGAVIELRYTGRRRETAVRINRRVKIRAARGYRPIVEFRPTAAASDSYQARAVWIPSGSLDLVGVDLVLSVDEAVSADQWSLFSLERADSLRLEGVTLTLLNPGQRALAAIELRPGAMMPDMPVAGVQPKPPLEIEITDSLVRGDGDLFLVRHAEPVRLAVKQSAVALQGTLLTARGHSESAHENAQLELRLEHVTCVLEGGLIRCDSGNAPRKLLPVHVSASNSIFSNSSGAPLVAMTGNSPPQDFRALLFWAGKNNFYDRYQTMWSIASTEGLGRTETWDAAAWRRNLTEASESSPWFDGVVWNSRQWTAKPFAELLPNDFSLDRQAANNPAIGGDDNFSDAGANLAALPRATASSGDDRPRD
ncbi:MAG: protein kinase domain-containing protein [Deltaproteobacteria bacterium]